MSATTTSVINDIFEAVIALAETASGKTIRVGALPANNGYAMQIASGAPATTFMTKGLCMEFSIVLNGKHTSQKTVSDTLNKIHLALTQAKTYPNDTTYQITDIETTSTPSYLDREEDKQYLYGSSLRVKAFIFKPTT